MDIKQLKSLGILLLFITPIFLSTIILFFAIIGIVHFCISIGDTKLCQAIPLNLGSILFYITTFTISIFTTKNIITSAKNDLNRDLNSIKIYLVDCILPSILNGIILTTILYKPAYNICCTVLEWLFYIVITIFVLNVAAILTGHAKPQI